MLFRLAAGLVSALFLVPGVLTAPALDTRAYSVKINGDVTMPWPNNQVIIAYEHDDTEVRLGEIVTEAMKLWEETGITIQTQVGWTHGENVLRATVNHDGNMATTVGYRPGTEMTLKFDPNPSEKVGNGNLVVAMAHELGHAFGLWHEHQRPDAYIKHLNFNCKNLKDYDEKKKAKAKYNMDQLCTNLDDARAATFSAAEFLPISEDYGFDASGEFDMDSLMRYGAKYGGKPQNAILGRKVVLSRQDKRPLEDPVRPSAGDIARLRALYPTA